MIVPGRCRARAAIKCSRWHVSPQMSRVTRTRPTPSPPSPPPPRKLRQLRPRGSGDNIAAEMAAGTSGSGQDWRQEFRRSERRRSTKRRRAASERTSAAAVAAEDKLVAATRVTYLVSEVSGNCILAILSFDMFIECFLRSLYYIILWHLLPEFQGLKLQKCLSTLTKV